MIPFSPSLFRNVVPRALLALLLGATAMSPLARAQAAPTFSTVIVFGDSLSDVGNVRQKMEDKFFLSYPGGDFNYSDGRFTNSSDTDPSSNAYTGVWHEQLARTFLQLPAPTASLNGGLDYAFGGATSNDGSSDRTVFDNPVPFGGGNNSITIDNLGRQIDRYLNQQTVDPAALFILWGGANDFFDDDSAGNVSAASHRVVTMVNRLITAGAKNILVPNVPPLGSIPFYGDDGNKQASLNRASAAYRDQLNADLDTNALLYSATNPPIIYRLDIWSLFVRFVANPGNYGFVDVVHPAQGESVNPDQYLFWDKIHPTTAGHFEIAKEANRVLSGAVKPTARAVNLSTRVNVQSGENVAIGGFIITGTQPKRLVLRGIGPSLTQHDVQGALANPVIELFDQAQTSLAVNDNWRDTQEVEIAATNLAPTNDLEAAMVQTLAPGSYTVVLGGKNNGVGVGLIEIYDVDGSANATFANASTRGAVGLADDVLIGGLIISQGDDAITVVRAIGPSLTSAGLANPLLDPILQLFDSNGVQIGANDDWRSTQPSAIKGTQLAPTNDRESVIVASLGPGSYTAVLQGKNSTTGVALIEFYRIP